ncbi:myotubularin-related protein 7 isoform X1 [Canis lupus dingo]|uniref:Myotubularin related protein 7 n=3 Tax=Canis lupus TaxID=9612 RepID=A0A8I3NKI3_CANLF|nr:myotubularin-related protein 7 isoform X1 [Canis lupus dingo]
MFQHRRDIPTRPSWSGAQVAAFRPTRLKSHLSWDALEGADPRAARAPQRSSKRPHPAQGPHCVWGNRGLAGSRRRPPCERSQPPQASRACSGRGAGALPGPAGRPRAGAAAPGGGAKARGPPAAGREAPSPRPSRRAAEARRCGRPRPPGPRRSGRTMEHIRTPKVENVRLVDRLSSKKAALGTLYLTATHVIFVENAPDTRKETWILHSQISTIEKQATTATGCPLLIRCKNFQLLQLIIPQERDCHDVYISLIRLARPVKYEELYCFSFNPKLDKEEREQGWMLIDLSEEYKRMGLPNNYWQLSDVNRDYRVCDSYPTELYVPKSATAHIIVGSSKFRSRRRFPALSYYYKDNHASICRSSQPLSGFSARCLEDEQMLQAIRKANPGSDFIYVVDTRPKLNAMANRAAGKGYENEDNYSNIKFQFIGIENIHVMRSSLQKMLEVCELQSPSMSDFLWGLENSGWLRHIKAIMDAGIFIAKAVSEEGASVLVHCSDGWDRTAQVCSVASLLLDPHYRTLKGFMVLIEKDWISFGHKFNHRYGNLDGDPKEISPVIDQFIECVWQLMEQFPCAFEFNERFLIHIQHHVYSCQFGNFLCNSQKERQELKIQERTYSLWAHLWKNRADYMNPLFRADHSQTRGTLRLPTTPCNFMYKFWSGMYNRFEKGLQPRQSVTDYLMAVKEETQQLEEELEALEERLKKIQKVQLNHTKVKSKPSEPSKHSGFSTSDNSTANTPQDYSGNMKSFPSRSPSQGDEDSALILTQDNLKSSDPDLSANSDQESGVEDLSCRSPSGGECAPSEDSGKDRDSDEAVFLTA